MPETKQSATARAKKGGFPVSNVTKATKGADKGMYFIAPKGVYNQNAQNAYANCRSTGGNQATCAAAAHKIQKGAKK